MPGKKVLVAGATGLVLHTLYLPLALCASVPSELTITGGTHVSTSPCYHFLYVTWRRYLELLGLKVSVHMLRPGFYPRGGGEIVAHIQPARPHGITWRWPSNNDHSTARPLPPGSACAGAS